MSNWQIIEGDSAEVLKGLADESVDMVALLCYNDCTCGSGKFARYQERQSSKGILARSQLELLASQG